MRLYRGQVLQSDNLKSVRYTSKERVKDKIGNVLEINMLEVNGSLQLSPGINGRQYK
ncbi:MAG: hypothetical protein IEMM0008_1229 [bacterium]|nr:MAG: hypothetical protein IEMM0008_1229 [bacterium]